MDDRFPWIGVEDDLEVTSPTGFVPFKITKKQIPGLAQLLAQLLAHCGTHISPNLDEIEAEIVIRQLLEEAPKGIITGTLACNLGKVLDYAAYINVAPGNDKSN